jgi:hypothetical protein
LKGAFDAHFFETEFGRFVDGGKTGGGFAAAAIVRAVFFERRLRAGDTVSQMGIWVGGPLLVGLIGGAVFVVLVMMHW